MDSTGYFLSSSRFRVEPTLQAAWVDQAVVAVEMVGRVAVAVEFIAGAVVAATDWSSY